MRDRSASYFAIVLDHVHNAAIRQMGHGRPGQTPQRDLVVQRSGKNRACFIEKPLCLFPLAVACCQFRSPFRDLLFKLGLTSPYSFFRTFLNVTSSMAVRNCKACCSTSWVAIINKSTTIGSD